MNQSIYSGLRWLVDSDIRIKEPSPLVGSFCGLYNAIARSYPFVYCEITAYAIQFLLRAAKWYQKDDLIELAKAGGEFLTRVQHDESDINDDGALPYGFNLPGKEEIQAYFTFDASICLAALVELYEVSGEGSYLKSANRIFRWLESLQEDDGLFSFGRAKDGHEPKAVDWYGNGGCLHVKNAIGLLKLYKSARDPKILDAADRVLKWGLSLQVETGAFKASKNCNYIFTHACCYAVEGLLYGYFVLKKPEYLRACMRAASWLLGVQNVDGSLYQYYGPYSELYLSGLKMPLRKLRKVIVPKETGATSQAMRIWLALYCETGDKAFEAAAHKAGKFILRMQSHDRSDPNSFGGFHSGCDSLWFLRYRSRLLYAWTAIFACHALNILDKRLSYHTLHSIIEELF